MKDNFRAPPKAAADKTASTIPNRIPPKDAAAEAPRTTANGDDQVMSTAVKKS